MIDRSASYLYRLTRRRYYPSFCDVDADWCRQKGTSKYTVSFPVTPLWAQMDPYCAISGLEFGIGGFAPLRQQDFRFWIKLHDDLQYDIDDG